MTLAHKPPATMTDVTLLNLVLIVVVILGAVRIMHFFRACTMRRLASRWSFQYIGPGAPPQWWWNTSHLKVPASLPGWISHLGVSQVWNIIEGKNNGMSMFIFDGAIGTGRSRPCTYIACQTEQSPFRVSSSVDRVIQIHGWTVLHGVWFLWFSWFMGIGRIDRHLRNLRSE